MYTVLLFAVIVMFLPSVFANSLALYCIIPDLKKKKTLIKQLLLALSVTDILGCTGVTIFQLINATERISPAMCPLLCFLAVYFTILSSAIATFIASERCLALRAPYWYQEYMFSWIIWTPLVVIVVILTVVCFLPQMGLGDTVLMRSRGNLSYVICGSFPDTMIISKKAVFSVCYGLMGLLLVIVNLSCNTAVLVTLRAMNKRILPTQRAHGSSYQEFEMTKMLLVLSANFLICWVPMNVELVMTQFGWESIPSINSFTQTLVGFNFVLDPLIYIIMMRKYREKIKKLFCCVKRRVDPEPHVTESAVNTIVLHNPVFRSATC